MKRITINKTTEQIDNKAGENARQKFIVFR